MFGNVYGGGGVRGVVKCGQVPGQHHGDVGKPCHDGVAKKLLCLPYGRARHPAGNMRWCESGDQKRRYRQNQEEVLQHVRGEEIGVAERINRGNEREQESEDADGKARDIRRKAWRGPEIPDHKSDAAHYDRWMNLPGVEQQLAGAVDLRCHRADQRYTTENTITHTMSTKCQ